MKLASFLGIAALAGGLLLTPAEAPAQTTIESLGTTVTFTPAATTDYLFRGISQTRSGPAIQAALDLEHSSGLYVGTFASNVAFPGTNLRQEVDFNFGYRFELGGVKFDVGGTYFGYPGYDADKSGGSEWAWWEANLRASWQATEELKLLGLVAYAPDFSFESGAALYIEGGVDLTIPYGFTVSLRAGYQWIDDNAAFGTPDYGVFSFGISREIVFGVIGALTLSHTTIDRDDCFGGRNFCGTRVIATVSRPF